MTLSSLSMWCRASSPLFHSVGWYVDMRRSVADSVVLTSRSASTASASTRLPMSISSSSRARTRTSFSSTRDRPPVGGTAARHSCSRSRRTSLDSRHSGLCAKAAALRASVFSALCFSAVTRSMRKSSSVYSTISSSGTSVALESMPARAARARSSATLSRQSGCLLSLATASPRRSSMNSSSSATSSTFHRQSVLGRHRTRAMSSSRRSSGSSMRPWSPNSSSRLMRISSRGSTSSSALAIASTM
mmetsp:Transcript_25251/g.88085  ORF Transcript_25251/g.88085 Transcript_25251/m.88085 type:complete len:246 (+) Transcript_25251:222-959(+)